MELVEDNNIKEFAVKSMPKMFCFGGHNVSIQADRIKNIEFAFWEDYKTGDYTPVLLVTLKDDTKTCVYYDSEEDAQEAIKAYKKGFIKVL